MFLRDINREHSKMQADIDNLNRHIEKLHNYVYQHIQRGVIEWSKLVIDHPRALILIMETTQVIKDGHASGESEPIRLTTLVPATGEVWDQLVCPTFSQEVRGAEYHGLKMTDLEDKPTLIDAWPAIVEALAERHLIIFGAEWAQNALRTVRQAHLLDDATCLQSKAKEYYNEFYDLSLQKILGYQQIDKTREHLVDSRERILMLLQVVRNFAVGMPKASDGEASEASWARASGDLDLEDLPDHPF